MTAVVKHDELDRALAELNSLDTCALIERVLTDERLAPAAVVSSFGAEAAVLLHLVSSVDVSTPVLFINTHKLFGETLRYSNLLQARFGLTDLRVVSAPPEQLTSQDPVGDLWLRDPNACCRLRKVEPLEGALENFRTWLTGRKRYQGGARTQLPRAEFVDGRIKVNPLADWSRQRVQAYFADHELPPHPLEADGFLSIGCFTCTDRVMPGEDARAGRWRGTKKTECGIHLPGSAASRLPTR